VRTVPVLILWVRVRVVRQASESFVAPDGGQVSADGMDDVVDSLPSESRRKGEQVGFGFDVIQLVGEEECGGNERDSPCRKPT
jgi:hypothetical protein